MRAQTHSGGRTRTDTTLARRRVRARTQRYTRLARSQQEFLDFNSTRVSHTHRQCARAPQKSWCWTNTVERVLFYWYLEILSSTRVTRERKRSSVTHTHKRLEIVKHVKVAALFSVAHVPSGSLPTNVTNLRQPSACPWHIATAMVVVMVPREAAAGIRQWESRYVFHAVFLDECLRICSGAVVGNVSDVFPPAPRPIQPAGICQDS
jgi:hypothetical protein